jgi:hypothetical protein
MNRLEAALRVVLLATGGIGITLRAAWVEGPWQAAAPKGTRRVAFAELLADARRNRIASNTEYVVTSES